jgi:hypothetical protein
MDLNAAFKNRFAFKVQWGYDEDVEARLVKFPTLRDVAKKVRDLVGTEITTPVSTNMLMEFETFATDTTLGLDFAMANFISAFDGDEQGAVKNVLDLNRATLSREVAIAASGGGDDDEELVEYDLEMDED